MSRCFVRFVRVPLRNRVRIPLVSAEYPFTVQNDTKAKPFEATEQNAGRPQKSFPVL